MSQSTSTQSDKVTQSYYQKSSPKILKFIEQQQQQEKQRLESQGARILPVKIRNTSLAIERRGKASTPLKINRIEFTTSYDFDNVQQILLSDAVQVPHGEERNLQYVNVILLVGGPVAMLVPYVFKKEKDNNLNEWMFVNSKGKTTRMRVENFQTVGEEE